MKTFELHPKMLTLGGTFYPTGYAVLMFEQAADAEQAARQLEEAGFASEDVMLLPPATILGEIGKVDADSKLDLPSVGTEGATVDKYINLARSGHHAVMVRAPSDKDTERVTAAVKPLNFSYGQKYHMLAMEDLESAPA